jgi:hypothetical protein
MTESQHPPRRLLEALQEQAEESKSGAMACAVDDNLDNVVIDGDFNLEAAAAAVYPFPSGDHTVIGPECFTDGTVICYKGVNYIEQPAPIAIGRYRNRLGVELQVEQPRVDRNIFGNIWEAVIPDGLFGDRRVLVTPDGLKDCGYVRIEEPEEKK